MTRYDASRSAGGSTTVQRPSVPLSPRHRVRPRSVPCAPRRRVHGARPPLVPLLGAAAGLLAACGSGDGAVVEADADNALVIEAGDIYYEPEDVEAAAGPIRFTLENVGVVEHDLVVEEVGDIEVVHAGAGETATGTIGLEPGRYTFYCSIEGHRTAGQEGTLEVG